MRMRVGTRLDVNYLTGKFENYTPNTQDLKNSMVIKFIHIIIKCIGRVKITCPISQLQTFHPGL
jgi:hypothetical protein